MNSRLRAVGGVLVTGLEVTLALLVLASVATLGELRAIHASGAASETAEGTFVVGFLGLWLLSGLGLLFVGGTHGLVGVFRSARHDRAAGLTDRLRRPVFEVLVAGATVVAFGVEPFATGWYSAVLTASAVLALAVLLHVVVDAVHFARGIVTDD